jgi:hypothetical protein
LSAFSPFRQHFRLRKSTDSDAEGRLRRRFPLNLTHEPTRSLGIRRCDYHPVAKASKLYRQTLLIRFENTTFMKWPMIPSPIWAGMGGEQLSSHFCFRNARCAADWTQNGFFPVLRIWAEFLGSNRRFFCLPRPAWINWSLFIKRSLFKVRTSRCAYRDVEGFAGVRLWEGFAGVRLCVRCCE